MNFGSVCSGIEAASVAFAPLGWKAIWFAEIEPFPAAVLAHHYPETPNLGDMTTIARRVLTDEVPAPEGLWGGTPCQAFSVAGLRQSLADARGNLTLKFVELADAIDHVRTRRGERECIVGWENVHGVLSTKDNAFGCFLAGLAGEDEPLQPPGKKWANAGAVYGPTRTVAWRTMDAQYFGVAQRRRRVFVVASARKGFDPAQVLFEWDGLRRDTAPSREARQVAPTIPSRSTAGGGLGTDFDCDGGVVQVCPTLRAGGNRTGGDRPPGTDVDTADSLVPVLAKCITTGTGLRYDADTDTDTDTDTILPVAFDTTQITSAANRSNPQPGDACHPLAAGAHAPAIAFPANLSGTQHASTENLSPALGAKNPTAVAAYSTKLHNTASNQAGKVFEEYTTSLDRSSPPPALLTATQVRRLTPTECERLQGFPDGYTDIPWTEYQRIQKRAAKAGTSFEAELKKRGKVLRGPDMPACPDGPRYKALGNSWAVPVAAWIGRRIQKQINNNK